MVNDSYNKVAKNALLLYIRTLISIVLQLIAVRFLLKYLGSEDYGLYGLVGSIVVVVESLKGLFSGSIQRFINIEIGKGNADKVRDIFNVGRKIHIYIGVILTVLTLIIGSVSIPFLNIPSGNIGQAYIVLLFTALNMGIGMIIVPYDAVIIAYEHFNALAYISIINSFLKLGIVFLLLLFPCWRVSVYAGLLLLVTIITRYLNYRFCKSRLKVVTEITEITDRSYYKELIKFTGYQSFGILSSSVQGTGINFLLNIFGGLIVNTARTIAYQVLAAVNVLVWNINLSFGPRCITLWGAGEYREFYKMMFIQSKICFIINAAMGCLIATFAIPILKLWLGEVPEYAVAFVQVIFVYASLRSFHDALDLPFKSSGIVKPFQIIITTCNLLSILLAWIFLELGYSYVYAFWAMVICEFAIVLVASIAAKIILNFPLEAYMKNVLSRTAICSLLLFAIFFVLRPLIDQLSVAMMIPAMALFFVITSAIIICIMFNRHELKSLKERFHFGK